VATTTQRARSASRRSQPRSSTGARGRASAAAERKQPSAAQRAKHGTVVQLPFVTAEFHRPDVQLPQDVEGAIGAVRKNLPPPEQLVYYGGLAALAMLSVIEWPVAAAIGVGTAVAQHAAVQRFGGRQRPAPVTR
jgi:hypothetical protein